MTKRYFGTDGIRGRVGSEPVTPDFMLRLGWAAGRVLAREGRSKVVIGKDTRISGYMFESALEAGLSAAGCDIHLLGPMPTPGIAYLTRTLHADAGIVISASHNPYYDNGIKFFSASGSKLPDDIEHAIESELDKPVQTVDASELGKAVRVIDAGGRYIEFCKSTIPMFMKFSGLRIVVDCAHGATYHVAPQVFDELDAEVIAIGNSPDGFNINAGCGALYPEVLSEAVLEHKADLGVALDGDGDRAILVDGNGDVVDGDEILYIIAESRLRAGQLDGAVVGTVMSNLGLEHALQALGVDFKRANVGDRHVIELLQQGGWTLGGETSGHVICLDRTTTGDGLVSALQVLAAMHEAGRSLQELKTGMSKYPQRMINVRIPDHASAHARSTLAKAPGVQQALREVETRLADRGRVLLRPSGTEPVFRVMVEGRDAQQVEVLAAQLASAVEKAVLAAPAA